MDAVDLPPSLSSPIDVVIGLFWQSRITLSTLRQANLTSTEYIELGICQLDPIIDSGPQLDTLIEAPKLRHLCIWMTGMADFNVVQEIVKKN